ENILYKHQHGFRPNKGTDVALAMIYETIATAQRDKHQVNVVARDVSKAFDKVWHHGLQFKIMTLTLPDIMEKSLCHFLVGRTARITLDGKIGPSFPLKSGVPQGSVISPTLYITYISDVPEPVLHTSCNIGFADDITQIITYPGRGREMMARLTKGEIENINQYEKQWKIQTNQGKFKILKISNITGNEIIINNNIIDYSRSIVTLGLEITRSGIATHIQQRIGKARAVNNKLRRFSGLSIKIKLHLYKALVLSVLEYPTVPLCIISKTSMLKLQRVQNQCIKTITRTEEENRNLTMKQLHEKYNMEPLNVRFWNRAKNIWEKLRTTNEDLVQKSTEMNTQPGRDHYW
ncbi:MAG: reverse transcriptase domain-containing protein, partial [Cyanobacteria bacterium J06582_2]